MVPPIPVLPADLPNPVLQMIRLAVSASRADGELTPQEREQILARAKAAGLDAVIEPELAQTSRPLAEIVRGITDPVARREFYTLAFTIVRADEVVTGAERIYLAQLAHQLGLDPAAVAAIEAETTAKIDAQPETETRTGLKLELTTLKLSSFNFQLSTNKEHDMDGSNQWYMAIGGHQVGPVAQTEIISNLQNGSIDAETLVFTAGMTSWQKVKDVAAFAAYVKGPGAASAGQAAWRASRRRRRPAAVPTTLTSRSTATRCSSSRSSSTRAKAPSPKPAR